MLAPTAPTPAPAASAPPSPVLRPAHGTRFETVLDSYVYALARTGSVEAIWHPPLGWIALLDGSELIQAFATLCIKQGQTVFSLDMPSTEIQRLRDTPAWLILEEGTGLVEVQAYQSLAAARIAFADERNRSEIVGYVRCSDRTRTRLQRASHA